jgi:hypothetical protein
MYRHFPWLQAIENVSHLKTTFLNDDVEKPWMAFSTSYESALMRSSALPAMYLPIINEDVAAGDGAFKT